MNSFQDCVKAGHGTGNLGPLSVVFHQDEEMIVAPGIKRHFSKHSNVADADAPHFTLTALGDNRIVANREIINGRGHLLVSGGAG